MESKEVFIKLYELNEKYHDTKEKRAWIAVSFYAAFTLGVANVPLDDLISSIGYLVTVIIPTIIFVCVYLFIDFQYRQKRISVALEGRLNKILSRNTDNLEKELRIYFKIVDKLNTVGVKCRKSDYRIEISMTLLLLTLYVVQLVRIIG